MLLLVFVFAVLCVMAIRQMASGTNGGNQPGTHASGSDATTSGELEKAGDLHGRSGKHAKERILHDAIRAVDQKLDELEISRVVDQSEALRRVNASPFIRERYKLGEDVEFCEQKVESKVIRRPNLAEEVEIRKLIDSGLAAVDGLEAATAAELRQQILDRHLDYKSGFMIVERATWKKPVIARDYIFHYHTEKVKRWDQEEGHTFGPDDETTAPGDLKAKGNERREAYIRRFGHLFEPR
jgi:hypothetical protein